MERDDRDVLEILKSELDFIEKGGYGRSVRTPWLPTSVFQDAPSCFCFPYRTHDQACALMDFVPPERRSDAVPCHSIPLNSAGETVESIESLGDQQRLEEAVKEWLRAAIERLEQQRAAASAA
jgi:hypothetical protein